MRKDKPDLDEDSESDDQELREQILKNQNKKERGTTKFEKNVELLLEQENKKANKTQVVK